MSADPPIARVTLGSAQELSWSRERRGEPVTVGVPLPHGAVRHATEITLETAGGTPVPVQVRALDLWPGGSIRWALISWFADATAARAARYTLGVGQRAGAGPIDELTITERRDGLQVATGMATFEFSRGGPLPLTGVIVSGASGASPRRAALQIQHRGQTLDVTIAAITVHERGPLRAEVELRGDIASPADLPLDIVARVELFAGLTTARIDVTLRNPRRARHARGQWTLGDAGSVFLESAVVAVDTGAAIDRVRCVADAGGVLEAAACPFEIYQESSGGARWNGPIHRNRHGQVPLRFRGYRLINGQASRQGQRANPIVVVDGPEAPISVAMPQFWQNFPRAIRAQGTTLELGLFPRQSGDLHELQGGEQKTHRMVIAFGHDRVSDPPLAWVHDPLRLHPPADWVSATGAVPYLQPAGETERGYAAVLETALDPVDGLLAKRETADEYGWRHFGDLHADHESAFQPPGQPFVSHYNNQYDAIAAFAVQFLRTGDVRWWHLMTDLALHVRDIDIYHTTEDKSAYNGGLFWHTFHYLDAGLSTHRTYPPGSAVSGGPSAEHNYNLGLMLHYFLTGERASRDAAIGLGAWVIRMDDGRRTPFRWLAAGPTGLASLTRDYHGPGRGAGHSILACLVAGRLSGDPAFAAKAEALIARCIHPRDDIPARQLLDAERRWSYTAFLQALGMYLDGKAERSEFDAAYGYARASLLHYARWMAAHERPYLEHPDELEYPTETWAAQELRKADVFFWAARHATGDERERFLERAWFFFDYAIRTLGGMAERRFTRPLILTLANGFRLVWLASHADHLPAPRGPEAASSFGPPTTFVPQRTTALRRLAALAVLTLLALTGLAVVLISD